jgi:hypothetical protein
LFHRAGRRRKTKLFVLVALGLLLGAAVGTSLGPQLLKSVNPHNDLLSDGAVRLYVSGTCEFSREALQVAVKQPASELVVIPIDLTQTEFRATHCRAAIGKLSAKRQMALVGHVCELSDECRTDWGGPNAS